MFKPGCYSWNSSYRMYCFSRSVSVTPFTPSPGRTALCESAQKWHFCILSSANVPHKYLCSAGLCLFLGTSVFSYCALYTPPAVSSVCPFPSKESSLRLPTSLYSVIYFNMASPLPSLVYWWIAVSRLPNLSWPVYHIWKCHSPTISQLFVGSIFIDCLTFTSLSMTSS